MASETAAPQNELSDKYRSLDISMVGGFIIGIESACITSNGRLGGLIGALTTNAMVVLLPKVNQLHDKYIERNQEKGLNLDNPASNTL